MGESGAFLMIEPKGCWDTFSGIGSISWLPVTFLAVSFVIEVLKGDILGPSAVKNPTST